MKRFRVAPAMLVVLLMAAMVAPTLPRAEAADAEFVITTLQTLREHYVDPISPVAMLNTALASLQQKTGVGAFSGPIPAGVSDPVASSLFTQRFDEILSRVGGQYTATDLAFAASAGMLESLHDSHTGFIPPAFYQEEKRKENGQAAYTGIGIYLLLQDGQFYIREVFRNSPAARAGLRPFDRIVAVNGQETAGRTNDEVDRLVRGPAGTTITVRVARPDVAAPLEFSVVRGPIQLPGLVSQMLDGGIGVVKIYEFVPDVATALRDAIFNFRRMGLRGLALDLRDNPGGLVEELRDISAALLPQSSPILQMTKRSGKTQLLQTNAPPILPSAVPMVVLVDEGSASASELLASALQEQGRADVVGTKTAGAVEIGITVDLPEDAGMAVTVARLLSGKGIRLEGHGVIPDDPVPLETVALNSGHDSQFDKALAILKQKLGAQGASPQVGAGAGATR
ncbi:MAG TPA: S41 family peptidase [bacterium]|nr:S41 family peptidase [bacterium]